MYVQWWCRTMPVDCCSAYARHYCRGAGSEVTKNIPVGSQQVFEVQKLPVGRESVPQHNRTACHHCCYLPAHMASCFWARDAVGLAKEISSDSGSRFSRPRSIKFTSQGGSRFQMGVIREGRCRRLRRAHYRDCGLRFFGLPRVSDETRKGYERYLTPWRLDKYYRVDRITLHFVIPDQGCTQFTAYFDTTESGLGRPDRYPGLVGDGDFFREDYKRREIGAHHFDCFADLDADGDLHLFKGGVEPFIYCYENVGGNRLVDRGRLTSGGTLFTLPRNGHNNRSWVVPHFCDWDRDGDLDLFGAPQGRRFHRGRPAGFCYG